MRVPRNNGGVAAMRLRADLRHVAGTTRPAFDPEAGDFDDLVHSVSRFAGVATLISTLATALFFIVR